MFHVIEASGGLEMNSLGAKKLPQCSTPVKTVDKACFCLAALSTDYLSPCLPCVPSLSHADCQYTQPFHLTLDAYDEDSGFPVSLRPRETRTALPKSPLPRPTPVCYQAALKSQFSRLATQLLVSTQWSGPKI